MFGGDLVVEGSTSISNIILENLTAEVVGVGTLDVDNEILVGSDPSIGGSGVRVANDGLIHAKSEVKIGGSGVPSISLRGHW